MPDYLQDLLDRVGDYMNPSQPPAAYDPTAKDEDNKKKKRPPGPGDVATPLPWGMPWGQQAGMLPQQAAQPDASTPPGINFLANPANPAYGVSPMSSPLSQAMAAKAAQAAPAAPVSQPPPAWAQQPAGLLDNLPGTTPAQFPTPPRRRPAGAPQREVDGSSTDPVDVRSGAQRGVPAQPPPMPPQGQGRLEELTQPPQQAAQQPQPPIPRNAIMQAAADQSGMLGGLGNVQNWLNQHSNMLMAIGAGFSGAPGLSAGMSRAASYGIPAAQADLARQTQLGGQQATYNALITAGVPHDLAVAGATNPKVMDKLMDSYITDDKMEIKEVKTKNAWGEESTQLIAVNPRRAGEAIDVLTGQPIHPSAAAGGTTIANVGGQGGGAQEPGMAPSQFYASGINDKNFDQTKVGEDYLNQFSPTVKQNVKDYLNGTFDPAGRQAYGMRIKTIASKYGAEVGTPADPTKMMQRKEWARGLGDVRTGVGLQTKGFQQGLSHMSDLSDTLVKMNPSGGLGFERLAHGINALRAERGPQAELISEAGRLGTSLAGEVGKLNSGQAGGGVHERATAAAALSSATQSRYAAAGALRGTLKLMEGGLTSLEQRRNELFGSDPKNWPAGSELMTDKAKQQIANVQKNIAKLEGKPYRQDAEIDRMYVPSEDQAAPAAAAGPNKVPWSVVQ